MQGWEPTAPASPPPKCWSPALPKKLMKGLQRRGRREGGCIWRSRGSIRLATASIKIVHAVPCTGTSTKSGVGPAEGIRIQVLGCFGFGVFQGLWFTGLQVEGFRWSGF